MNKTMNNNVVLRTQIYNLLYCTGCVTVKHLIKGPFLFVIKSIESKEKKIMCDLYLEKKYLILVFFLLFWIFSSLLESVKRQQDALSEFCHKHN